MKHVCLAHCLICQPLDLVVNETTCIPVKCLGCMGTGVLMSFPAAYLCRACFGTGATWKRYQSNSDEQRTPRR